MSFQPFRFILVASLVIIGHSFAQLDYSGMTGSCFIWSKQFYGTSNGIEKNDIELLQVFYAQNISQGHRMAGVYTCEQTNDSSLSGLQLVLSNGTRAFDTMLNKWGSIGSDKKCEIFRIAPDDQISRVDLNYDTDAITGVAYSTVLGQYAQYGVGKVNGQSGSFEFTPDVPFMGFYGTETSLPTAMGAISIQRDCDLGYLTAGIELKPLPPMFNRPEVQAQESSQFLFGILLGVTVSLLVMAAVLALQFLCRLRGRKVKKLPMQQKSPQTRQTKVNAPIIEEELQNCGKFNSISDATRNLDRLPPPDNYCMAAQLKIISANPQRKKQKQDAMRRSHENMKTERLKSTEYEACSQESKEIQELLRKNKTIMQDLGLVSQERPNEISVEMGTLEIQKFGMVKFDNMLDGEMQRIKEHKEILLMHSEDIAMKEFLRLESKAKTQNELNSEEQQLSMKDENENCRASSQAFYQSQVLTTLATESLSRAYKNIQNSTHRLDKKHISLRDPKSQLSATIVSNDDLNNVSISSQKIIRDSLISPQQTNADPILDELKALRTQRKQISKETRDLLQSNIQRKREIKQQELQEHKQRLSQFFHSKNRLKKLEETVTSGVRADHIGGHHSLVRYLNSIDTAEKNLWQNSPEKPYPTERNVQRSSQIQITLLNKSSIEDLEEDANGKADLLSQPHLQRTAKAKQARAKLLKNGFIDPERIKEINDRNKRKQRKMCLIIDYSKQLQVNRQLESSQCQMMTQITSPKDRSLLVTHMEEPINHEKSKTPAPNSAMQIYPLKEMFHSPSAGRVKEDILDQVNSTKLQNQTGSDWHGTQINSTQNQMTTNIEFP